MLKKSQKQQEQRSKFFTEEDLKKVFLFPDSFKSNTIQERKKYGKTLVNLKDLTWKRMK